MAADLIQLTGFTANGLVIDAGKISMVEKTQKSINNGDQSISDQIEYSLLITIGDVQRTFTYASQGARNTAYTNLTAYLDATITTTG